MKGKVDILANFPIDTSLKKKTHSAMKQDNLKNRKKYNFWLDLEVESHHIAMNKQVSVSSQSIR